MEYDELIDLSDRFHSRYRDPDALLDAVINATLCALCVPANLLGYRYLFLAVRYIRKTPQERRLNMLRDIYPHVADLTGTNPAMAERAMRYAISCAWKRADPEVLYSYLGLRGRDLKNAPTNVEFLYLVAERVRLITGDPEDEERFMRLMEEARKRFGG